MKVFANINILKKVAIIFVLLTSISTIAPKPCEALDLVRGTVDLSLKIGDGAVRVLHDLLIKQNMTLIHMKEKNINWLNVVIITIATIVTTVALVATWGAFGLLGATFWAKTLACIPVLLTGTGLTVILCYSSEAFKEELNLPLYSITPETIFSNKVPIFDVNFINPNHRPMQYKKEDGTKGDIYALTHDVQGTVAKWYVTLRMIATVGMMSVLVYIGIRILISSVASQKAKYKQLLGDWVMGIIILFTMHYIMNFSNKAVEQLSNLLASVNPTDYTTAFPDKINGIDKTISEKLKDLKIPEEEEGPDGENRKIYEIKDGIVAWHTGLMGEIRIRADAYNTEDGQHADDGYIGYALMFLVMVMYTIMFSWTYLRRVIYIGFLTLIAPLVAITYPIDKATDGKAQGFNYWLKEYIFNLLIQPMHLLLYTILVSSSIEFAGENWIYALVSIGFVLSAEKILRTMFNFNKAETPGTLSGMKFAALTMAGMRFLFGLGPRGGNGDKDDESSDDNGSAGTKTRLNMDVLNRLGLGPKQQQDKQQEANKANIRLSKKFKGKYKNKNGKATKGKKKVKAPKKDKKIKKPKMNKKDFKTGMKNAKGKFIAGQKNRMQKRIKNTHPIKTGRRLLSGAAVGAVSGTIGLSAGIASGDATNALKYGIAGAAGGYNFGANVSDKIADLSRNAAGVEDVGEQFMRGYLGEEEYANRQIEQQIQKHLNDDKLVESLQKSMGGSREDAMGWIRENGGDLIDSNVDSSEWANIYGTIGREFDGVDGTQKIENVQQAILGAQMEQMYGGIEDRDERYARMLEDIEGATQEEIKAFDNLRNQFSKTKRGIK